MNFIGRICDWSYNLVGSNAWILISCVLVVGPAIFVFKTLHDRRRGTQPQFTWVGFLMALVGAWFLCLSTARFLAWLWPRLIGREL